MASIAIIQLYGWSGVRILVGANYLSLLQNVQTGPGAHPTFYLRGSMVLSRDYCGQDVKLTTELYRFFSCMPSRRGYTYLLGAEQSGD
jgi:hypothetical protein